jgi:phosphate transport system ATP-binding protein
MNEPLFSLRNLSVVAGARELLRRVSLEIPPGGVFGVIGPSGAGKSTLLKCLNRMVDLTPGLRVSGEVRFHGRDLFWPGVDADAHRARVGMLFQQPVVFPKSILQNVVFGVRQVRRVPRRAWGEMAERALTEAALWSEVRDRLHESALRLSVGQQQRLCLARTLALDPEVILMDEPTSALDQRSTEAIEQLILTLREHRTIVLVTHNLGQARRVAQRLACVQVVDGAGTITACGECGEVLRTVGKTGEEMA